MFAKRLCDGTKTIGNGDALTSVVGIAGNSGGETTATTCLEPNRTGSTGAGNSPTVAGANYQATLELEAPGSGVFSGILLAAGGTVPVGVPTAEILVCLS